VGWRLVCSWQAVGRSNLTFLISTWTIWPNFRSHRCRENLKVSPAPRRNLCAASAAAQQSASEYQVKAAYLYNFAKMSQWPAQSLPGRGFHSDSWGFRRQRGLRQCFAGDARRQKINGQALEIRHVHSAEELKYCHPVFFAHRNGLLLP
jgi:hypothetical protein